METKVCGTCNQTLPVSEFHRHHKHGYQNYCKTCKKEKYKKTRDYYIQYSKDNYLKNRATPKQYLRNLKAKAKKRNLEFNLTEEDIVIPEHCPLLGIQLEMSIGSPSDNSPSADRIDSTKGYIKGNVWFISTKANRMKNDATIEELELLAANLRKRFNSL